MGLTDDQALVVRCHSYTHARRFPIVIGKVGGFVLPTPLSPSQIATLIGSFFAMLATRGVWGAWLPGVGDALLMAVVPGTLTWAVRHLRMEGRSPVKMAFGVAALVSTPTQGKVRGRQVWHQPRSVRLSQRIFVAGSSEPAKLVGDAHQTRLDVAQIRPALPWASLSEALAR